MSILVTVRSTMSAYVASAFGLRVSSTASAGAAAERLAAKLFGEHQRINVCEKYPDSTNHLLSQWEVEPDVTQACRVCGCTYNSPCKPVACHWVEADLCSECVKHVVQIGPTDI